MWRATDGTSQARGIVAKEGSRRTSAADPRAAAEFAVPARDGGVRSRNQGSLLRRLSLPGSRPVAAETRYREVTTPRVRIGVGRLTRLVVAVLVVLVLGLLGLTVSAFFVPHATIVVTPAIEHRTYSLTYGVRGWVSQGVDWLAPSRSLTVTVEAEVQRPASGKKEVPDGFAQGMVRIVNATTRATTLPVGMELLGVNGVRYRLVQEVTVPPADPFGSQAFGVVDVPIVSTIPGPEGNAGPGEVAGEIENGLLYRNLLPVSGGTVKTISVVTEGDVSAAREAAQQKLRDEIPLALRRAMGEREETVDTSISVAAPTIEVSAQPGTEADTVSARARTTVTALVYAPDEVHRLAQEEAARRLTQSAGPSVVILGKTLTFGEPNPIGAGQWRVEVSGDFRVVPSESALGEVREKIAGRSVNDALRTVREVPGVRDVRITIDPDWWPARLPARPAQIEVTIGE